MSLIDSGEVIKDVLRDQYNESTGHTAQNFFEGLKHLQRLDFFTLLLNLFAFLAHTLESKTHLVCSGVLAPDTIILHLK